MVKSVNEFFICLILNVQYFALKLHYFFMLTPAVIQLVYYLLFDQTLCCCVCLMPYNKLISCKLKIYFLQQELWIKVHY